MFYDAIQNQHGLKHDPFKALLAPRPIGWIGTISNDGIANLAPYSFFNAVGDRPAYVVFGTGGVKDSLRNIQENGEFTCSMSTWDLREHMNMSSAAVPANVDEFPLAGLTGVRGKIVKAPYVKEAAAVFECKHWKTIELPAIAPQKGGYIMVVGYVVGVHIDDRYIKDGIVNTSEMRPLGRMGYMEYAVVTPETTFSMNRPEVDKDGNVVGVPTGTWDGKYR
jgi:flavin reductase (DIM6/NTAB) family NADH-FMN oxidoreductase RutF